MKIKKIKAKSLIGSNSKPDSWFGCKYTINLYRGCEHQCIYCDSRSECYQIDDFENELLVKANAVEVLKDQLPRKRIKGTICFGAMNDPYTSSEANLKLTQQALEVIAQNHFPIHLMTKSTMVLRDKEIIRRIGDEFAAMTFTITTVDNDLATKVEPGAPLPTARLAAMKELADMGIYTGVTMMPILPFIEDSEENVLGIVRSAAEHGAKYLIPSIGMTMRDRQRTYYYKKLDELFPGVKEKYMKQYGDNYGCMAPSHKKLMDLVRSECNKLGLPLQIKVYEPRKVTRGQMKLLES